MQTFLPYADFVDSAKVLDRQRLGKQRVEAYQILRTLRGESNGWSHHPATRMWKEHTQALAAYGFVVCSEWIARGYKDNLRLYFAQRLAQPKALVMPEWLGDEAFHLSHQSNLVRKDPQHYGAFFPDVPSDLPYVWPIWA